MPFQALNTHPKPDVANVLENKRLVALKQAPAWGIRKLWREQKGEKKKKKIQQATRRTLSNRKDEFKPESNPADKDVSSPAS